MAWIINNSQGSNDTYCSKGSNNAIKSDLREYQNVQYINNQVFKHDIRSSDYRNIRNGNFGNIRNGNFGNIRNNKFESSITNNGRKMIKNDINDEFNNKCENNFSDNHDYSNAMQSHPLTPLGNKDGFNRDTINENLPKVDGEFEKKNSALATKNFQFSEINNSIEKVCLSSCNIQACMEWKKARTIPSKQEIILLYSKNENKLRLPPRETVETVKESEIHFVNGVSTGKYISGWNTSENCLGTACDGYMLHDCNTDVRLG